MVYLQMICNENVIFHTFLKPSGCVSGMEEGGTGVGDVLCEGLFSD